MSLVDFVVVEFKSFGFDILSAAVDFFLALLRWRCFAAPTVMFLDTGFVVEVKTFDFLDKGMVDAVSVVASEVSAVTLDLSGVDGAEIVEGESLDGVEVGGEELDCFIFDIGVRLRS